MSPKLDTKERCDQNEQSNPIKASSYLYLIEDQEKTRDFQNQY